MDLTLLPFSIKVFEFEFSVSFFSLLISPLLLYGKCTPDGVL